MGACAFGALLRARQLSNLFVSGDGYAYLAYDYPELDTFCGDSMDTRTEHVTLLRVSSSGAYDKIKIIDVPGIGPEGMLPDGSVFGGGLITNADTGVLLTWTLSWDAGCAFVRSPTGGAAVTNGTSVTLVSPPAVRGGAIAPVLQAQDGSFVGTYQGSSGQTDMIAFDISGNVRWTVPNDTPLIATADGGVIGQSGITYDANGNATGQIDSASTRSWFGYAYQVGSVEQVFKHAQYVAGGYWPFKSANLSKNSTAVLNQWFPPLKSCVNNGGQCVGPLQPSDFMWNAEQDLVRQLQQVTASTAPPQQQQCATLIQTMLNGMSSGDSQGRPITIASFVGYVQHNPSFYDGSKSTLSYNYAFMRRTLR